MRKQNLPGWQFLVMFIIVCIPVTPIQAQITVGLDNWYNHETNSKTGKPFHYLWTDTEASGYSRWGEIFTSKGSKIVTVGRPMPGVLKNLGIYIIVDPDTTTENPTPNYVMPEEIKTIQEWVRNGGVLALMANDAPNCEFTHFNQLASVFGLNFNHVTLLPVTGTNFEMGALTKFPDHPIFKGVSKIYLKEVSSIRLSGAAKAILVDKGNVLMAEAKYGKGYVFAIGDPWIYNEYIDHDRLPEDFNNRKAAENLTVWLLSLCKR